MKIFKDFTNVYAEVPQVTAEIQTMLNDHFWNREVCDDDNFLFFWKRNINRYYDKFVKLQLAEMVTDFENDFKTEVIGKIIANTENTDTKTGTDGTRNTRTGSDTTENARTGTDTSKSTGNTTDTLTNTSDAISRELTLQTPQSVQYGATQTASQNLDWTYVSAQRETSGKAGDNTTRTDRDLTDSTTYGSKDKNTTTYNSGSDQTTTYNSQVGSKGKSTTDNTTTTTGYNQSQVDRYSKAYNYIVLSDAFAWFVSKLSICFIGVYDI